MKLVNLIVLLSTVLVFAWSSACCAGTLTYQLLNGYSSPPLGGEFYLGGIVSGGGGGLGSGLDTIETDGNLGPLSSADVLGCTWFSYFYNGWNSPIYSSSASFAGITATQTQLILSDPGYFELSGEGSTLAYDFSYGQLPPFPYDFTNGFIGVWLGTSDGAQSSLHEWADPPSQLVIAEAVTTPEPGTAALLAAGTAGLVGVRVAAKEGQERGRNDLRR